MGIRVTRSDEPPYPFPIRRVSGSTFSAGFGGATRGVARISPITVSNDTASSPYSTNLSMASPFLFAQHRSHQRRSRRQFLQHDRFMHRMCAFANSAHPIQRGNA